MVTTRNQTAKKIKFNDDEDVDVIDTNSKEPSVIPVPSQSASAEESDDESDEDSDDAPEEESTSKAKDAIIQKERAKKEAELEAKRIERERRRQKDLYNKQQQQEKKQKVKEQPLPEFLPDDILQLGKESAEPSDAEDQRSMTIKPKHKKSDELDRELARQLKLEKLKKLKTKDSIKRGPVHVKVLKATKGVPKAEARIGAKEKWLKRKALNKK